MKLIDKQTKLNKIITELGSVMIAFSGGVDSTYLTRVAFDCLGDKAVAVIGKSPSLPQHELANAVEFANDLGVRIIEVETGEMDNLSFVTNAPDRCFHCKSVLFGTLTELAQKMNIPVVIEGSNFSDMSDYRPGFAAVDKFEVRSPLKEAELTKDEIRTLSQELGLPTWDKPAAPCLSSRIPYGSIITFDKLSRVEQAEAILRDIGLKTLRVRDHDSVARIEIPRKDFDKVLNEKNSATITEDFKKIGYNWVTIDILGFRSGSLNETLDDDIKDAQRESLKKAQNE